MGAVDPLQLRSALGHQQQWGGFLGKIVVEQGFCAWDDVMRALSIQTGHPLVDLDATPLDLSLAAVIPTAAANKLRAIPLRIDGKRKEILVAAVAAPAPLDVQDALMKASGKAKVEVHLANDQAIGRAID